MGQSKRFPSRAGKWNASKEQALTPVLSPSSTYFRDRSHFAQTLAAERHINHEYNPAKKRNASVQHVEDAQVKR